MWTVAYNLPESLLPTPSDFRKRGGLRVRTCGERTGMHGCVLCDKERERFVPFSQARFSLGAGVEEHTKRLKVGEDVVCDTRQGQCGLPSRLHA